MYLREGNEPGETTKITYRELLVQVCQFSNVLRKQGEYQCGRGTRGPNPELSEELKKKRTRNGRNLVTGTEKLAGRGPSEWEGARDSKKGPS